MHKYTYERPAWVRAFHLQYGFYLNEPIIRYTVNCVYVTIRIKLRYPWLDLTFHCTLLSRPVNTAGAHMSCATRAWGRGPSFAGARCPRFRSSSDFKRTPSVTTAPGLRYISIPIQSCARTCLVAVRGDVYILWRGPGIRLSGPPRERLRKSFVQSPCEWKGVYDRRCQIYN